MLHTPESSLHCEKHPVHSISPNHTFHWNVALFVRSGSSISCPGTLPLSVMGLVLPFGLFLDPGRIRVSGSPDNKRSLTPNGEPPIVRFPDVSALTTAAVVELSLELEGSTDMVTAINPGYFSAGSEDSIVTCDTATLSCSATDAFNSSLFLTMSFSVIKTRSVNITGTTQSHVVPPANTISAGHCMQYFVNI